MRFILGTYLVLTIAAGIILATGLFFYLQPANISYIVPTLLILIIGTYLFFILKSSPLKTINSDGAALLTEKKHPELNNSIINSLQLGEFVKDPDREKVFSSVIIRELIARTNKQLTKLDADEIIEKGKTEPARNLFLATLAVGIVTTLLFPNFWQQALIKSK